MMPIASVPATSTVARTNWVSETQATRPEESRARSGSTREDPHDPGPDPVAVGEEEVRREQHDEEAGDDVAERRTDLAELGWRASLPWRSIQSWVCPMQSLICESLACSGPVCSQLLDLAEAVDTWPARSSAP